MPRPDAFQPIKKNEQIKRQAADLAHSLGRLATGVTTIANSGEILENTLEETGNDLPLQERVILFATTSGFGQMVFDYVIGSIWIDESLDGLRMLEDTYTKAFTTFQEDTSKLEPFFQYVDRVELLSPLTNAKRGREFFDQVSQMSLPLSEDNRKEIDAVFVNSGDPQDILMALFIAQASMQVPTSWEKKLGSLGSKKAHQQEMDGYVDSILAVSKAYMEHYYQRCIEAFDGKINPDEIFPSGSDQVLVPLVAHMVAQKLELLPENFLLTLGTDFIPGLTLDAKRLFAIKYGENFDRSRASTKLDDAGYSPYQHVQESFQKGKSIDYLGACVENYIISFPDSSSSEIPFAWINQQTFDKVKKHLGSMVMTVAADADTIRSCKLDDTTQLLSEDLGIKAIDIGSYSDRTLEIILIGEKVGEEVAFALQVDVDGRLLGVPQYIQEPSRPFLAYLDNLVHSFLFPQAEQKAKTPHIPSRRIEKSRMAPVIPAYSRREEKLARYGQKKEPKKHILRRAGLLAQQAEEASISKTQEGEKQDTKKFLRTFTPTQDFLKQRQELQSKEQEQLDILLDQLRTTPGGMKPLNLKRESIEGNIYSARLGKDRRVIFIQTGSGQFALVRVEPRGRVYDQLKADFVKIQNMLEE